MPRSRGGRDLVRPYGPSAIKMPDKEFQILMEDAEILWPNFEGRPGDYNQAGQRNFCVILDPEVAEDMAADGWNVKQTKGYQDEEGDFYISVDVKYRDRFGNELRPPKIQIITSNGPVHISEDEVHFIDKVDAAKVDLIINGRTRFEDGQQKVKGYLQTYFVTLNEDYLEKKYADVLAGGETDSRAEFLATQKAIAELEGPNTDETAGMDIVDAELVEGTDG